MIADALDRLDARLPDWASIGMNAALIVLTLAVVGLALPVAAVVSLIRGDCDD